MRSVAVTFARISTSRVRGRSGCRSRLGKKSEEHCKYVGTISGGKRPYFHYIVMLVVGTTDVVWQLVLLGAVFAVAAAIVVNRIHLPCLEFLPDQVLPPDIRVNSFLSQVNQDDVDPQLIRKIQQHLRGEFVQDGHDQLQGLEKVSSKDALTVPWLGLIIWQAENLLYSFQHGLQVDSLSIL